MSTKRKQNKPQKLNYDQINKCNSHNSIETIEKTSIIKSTNLNEIDTHIENNNLLPSSETHIMTSTITAITSPNNNNKNNKLKDQSKLDKETLARKIKFSEESFLNKGDLKFSKDDRIINNNSNTSLNDLDNTTMNKIVDLKENLNNKSNKREFDLNLKLNASELQQKQQLKPNYNNSNHMADHKDNKLDHLLNFFYLNNNNNNHINKRNITPPTTTSPTATPNANSSNNIENQDYANFLKTYLAYTSSNFNPSLNQHQQQKTTSNPVEEMIINNLTPYLFNQAQIQMYQQQLQQQQQGVNPLFPLVSQFPQLQTPQFTNPFQFNYSSNYQNLLNNNNNQFNQLPKNNNDIPFNNSNFNLFELLKSNMLNNSNPNELYAQSMLNKNMETEINKHKRSYTDEMQCSCGVTFDSLDLYLYHLKQSNHKPKTMSSSSEIKSLEPPTKKLNSSQTNANNTKHSGFAPSKPAQTYDSRQLTSAASKMVRGQEEWVNSSRNNNFISQVLKCLECSASFKTLEELGLHMVNSNHFSKFHPTSVSTNTSLNFAQNMNGYKEGEAKKKIISPVATVKTNNLSTSKANSAFSMCTSNNKQTIPNVNSFNNNNEKQTQLNHRNQDDSASIKCKLSNKNNLMLNQIGTNCKICNKKFNSQLPPLVELIQHLQNEHGITQICTNCGAHFDTSSELQTHLIEEQNFHNSLNFSRNHYKNQTTSLVNDMKQIRKNDAITSPAYSNSYNKLKNEDENQSNKKFKKSMDSIELEKTKKPINAVKQCLNSSTSSSSSISPSSLSSHSSNSSPSSFLFESNTNNNNNKHTNDSNKNDKFHHPLLALQMFVNGNSQTSPYSSSASLFFNSSNTSSINNISPMSKESTASSSSSLLTKLTAKAKSYAESEGEEEENTNKGVKRALNDSEITSRPSKLIKAEANSENNNDKLNDLKKDGKFNLVSANQCHPLHLLQKMHMNLDDFLYR